MSRAKRTIKVAGLAWPSVEWAAEQAGGAVHKAVAGAASRDLPRGTQHLVALAPEQLPAFLRVLGAAHGAPCADTQSRRAVKRVEQVVDGMLEKAAPPDPEPEEPAPKPRRRAAKAKPAKPAKGKRHAPRAAALAPIPDAGQPCMREVLLEQPGAEFVEFGQAGAPAVVAFRVGEYALRVVLHGGVLRYCNCGPDGVDPVHQVDEPVVQLFHLLSPAPAERWPTGCAWTGADVPLSSFMRMRFAFFPNPHMPRYRLEPVELQQAQMRIRTLLADARTLPTPVRAWLERKQVREAVL